MKKTRNWLWETVRFWVAYFSGRWNNLPVESLNLIYKYPYLRLRNKGLKSIFDKHDLYCYRLVFKKNNYKVLH